MGLLNLKGGKSGPKWYKDDHAELEDAIYRNRPIGIGDTIVSDTAAGRAVNAGGGRAGGGVATVLPFGLSLKKVGGSYQGLISTNSWLLNSLRPNDKYTITGLGVWFPVQGTDAIWLGVVFNRDGEPTSASIDSWGQGDQFQVSANAWSNNNSYCEDDGDSEDPRHQTSRVLLHYTIAGDQGQPVPVACCISNLILRSACIDDRPARFAFPSPYAPYAA